MSRKINNNQEPRLKKYMIFFISMQFAKTNQRLQRLSELPKPNIKQPFGVKEAVEDARRASVVFNTKTSGFSGFICSFLPKTVIFPWGGLQVRVETARRLNILRKKLDTLEMIVNDAAAMKKQGEALKRNQERIAKKKAKEKAAQEKIHGSPIGFKPKQLQSPFKFFTLSAAKVNIYRIN